MSHFITQTAGLREVFVGDFFFPKLEIVSFISWEKNVAITNDNELPCNVTGIRTTAIDNKGYALHTEIKLLLIGEDPNPAPRKFPYEELARKRWYLEIQNTYTAAPGYSCTSSYQVPGI